ncbi:dUTP diphosphatase [bacterium]|nr:dUTP diphosphatase [bacterium]
MIEIQITRLPHAPEKLPEYKSAGAAGMDLCLASEDLELKPGARALLPTGFAVAIPEGFEGQIRMRSSFALRTGLLLPNAPGTIDPDYRGELKVLVMNASREAVTVHAHERFAQLIISPVERCEWRVVEKLPESARSEGGFGSTG